MQDAKKKKQHTFDKDYAPLKTLESTGYHCLTNAKNPETSSVHFQEFRCPIPKVSIFYFGSAEQKGHAVKSG